MTRLKVGGAFPRQQVPRLGGGTLTLGAPQGGYDWQLVVVYRGLHCPICKTYLAELNTLESDFHNLGVDVIAVSTDPADKAKAMADEMNLSLPIGHDLGFAQMAELGLYVSDPRSPAETDRPFAEPGTFVINAEGSLQIVDISNAPFVRPDLEGLLKGIQYIRKNDYPVRGTHAFG